jgi:ABC-type polysaccharide/polyol phosphate export permease
VTSYEETTFAPRPGRPAELAKLAAFVRRDFLTAISYRMAFVTDIVSLAGHVVVFYFIGLLVDDSKLPTYGGSSVTYLEYASIGIALGLFLHFTLERVATALRAEQMIGTLEALLTTPTRTLTLQLGSVAFDFLYIPIRLGLFLAAIALAFGLRIEAAGILPSVLLVLAFAPFVWGLGVASAAAVITFRRGAGLVGFGGVILGLLSGVYFPTALLPGWLGGLVAWNPVALTIEGIRTSLLGTVSWSSVAVDVGLLAPISVVSVLLGMTLFRAAIRRERRLGTLGLY